MFLYRLISGKKENEKEMESMIRIAEEKLDRGDAVEINPDTGRMHLARSAEMKCNHPSFFQEEIDGHVSLKTCTKCGYQIHPNRLLKLSPDQWAEAKEKVNKTFSCSHNHWQWSGDTRRCLDCGMRFI